MSMVGFPLLLIPLAIVNILVFLMPGVSFTAPLMTLTMASQASWTITFGDLLLTLSMLLLLFEVLKAARPGGKYFTDHFLALLVFAGATAEFVLLPQFATSVFFLLTVLMLVDFLAGVTLRLRRANRQAALARAVASEPPQAPVAAAPEPRPEPVLPPPMATIDPARPVASSVAPPGAADAPIPGSADLSAH
jgi:hypothetical protein